MIKGITFKNIFLIDAAGALVTALLLSQLLARFESWFGMPSHFLYILAAVAGLFAVYSFLMHWLAGGRKKQLLAIIAVANLLYCVATLVLMIKLNGELTLLGIAYFAGEILVILGLVRLEMGLIRHRNV